jgi:hypothetical protein
MLSLKVKNALPFVLSRQGRGKGTFDEVVLIKITKKLEVAAWPVRS